MTKPAKSEYHHCGTKLEPIEKIGKLEPLEKFYCPTCRVTIMEVFKPPTETKAPPPTNSSTLKYLLTVFALVAIYLLLIWLGVIPIVPILPFIPLMAEEEEGGGINRAKYDSLDRIEMGSDTLELGNVEFDLDKASKEVLHAYRKKHFRRLDIPDAGSADSIIYTKGKERNKVNKLLNTSLLADEDIPLVAWNNKLLVGLMGTGKSIDIDSTLEKIYRFYPSKQVNLVYSNSMMYNIEHLKPVFYNILVCDDAVELQDSYASIGKKSRALSHKVFSIRHILERNYGLESGMILTIWGVQMYKALQKRLRQSPLTSYTSTFNDKEENTFLFYQLGQNYFEFLDLKTDLVYLNLRFDYNRYNVLKANRHLYYCETPMPDHHWEQKVITADEKGDRELEIIKLMFDSGVPRQRAYEICEFIHSENITRTRINDTESEYYRYLRKRHLSMNVIAELFGRATDSVKRHLVAYT